MRSLGVHDWRLARLEALIREHHATVLRYVWRRAPREYVDSVMAETFLVAWRRLDDVPDDALPWLIGVARNVIATERRTTRRREALILRLGLHHRPVHTLDEQESPIAQAFERLSDKDREVLMLMVVEEMTAEEAAAALGELPNAIRSRVRRAKPRLARALEQVEREEAGAWRADALKAKERTP